MGVLNRYCGNCKHFKNEDVEGWGWCSFNDTKTHCAQSWDCHNSTFNGWTEITPDNMEEVYCIDQDRLVVQYTGSDCHIIRMIGDFFASISTMAKCGGYYYYVLPELKIE